MTTNRRLDAATQTLCQNRIFNALDRGDILPSDFSDLIAAAHAAIARRDAAALAAVDVALAARIAARA